MTLFSRSWNTASYYRVGQRPTHHASESTQHLFGLMLKFACMALLLNLTLTSAWAQSTAAGTVSGQITDQTGAAIAGGSVTLVIPPRVLHEQQLPMTLAGIFS